MLAAGGVDLPILDHGPLHRFSVVHQKELSPRRPYELALPRSIGLGDLHQPGLAIDGRHAGNRQGSAIGEPCRQSTSVFAPEPEPEPAFQVSRIRTEGKDTLVLNGPALPVKSQVHPRRYRIGTYLLEPKKDGSNGRKDRQQPAQIPHARYISTDNR